MAKRNSEIDETLDLNDPMYDEIDDLFDDAEDAEGVSGDDEDCSDDEEKVYDWNLIDAFDRILISAKEKEGRISDDTKSRSAHDYLVERLGMTTIQIIVIAMLLDEGCAMSLNDLGKRLHLSRLKMMAYTIELEDLATNRMWLNKTKVYENRRDYAGYELENGVENALCRNEVFQPANIEGLDTQTLLDIMTTQINTIMENPDPDDNEYVEEKIMTIVQKNKNLPLCKEILSLDGDIHNKCLLPFIICDCNCDDGWNDSGTRVRALNKFFPDDWDCEHMRKNLSSGQHELMQRGWIEQKCEDGMADPTTFVITRKTKDELLQGISFASAGRKPEKDRDLVSYKDIKPKQLYYNKVEQKTVDRLRRMLSQEQFPQIQKRLEEEGMRTGVAVLLNGGPGTGKTELVRQLSRETERDLLMIDISEVKDKWVGESEKNCKAIFERYNRLCKNRKVKPILFINECDAILGKRLANVNDSVDKMQNAMQNILLQALEDFEGIIICTTNLAEQGLDKAFMRRFLVKAEFTKPDADTRTHIWQSMLPKLNYDDAHTLAERYDFSGGQCENVKRKATIEHVINGTDVTLTTLDEFCQEETVIEKSASINRIKGFAN